MLTNSLASLYFFLISIETVTTLPIRCLFAALTCPLGAQTKLRCLELMRPEQSNMAGEGGFGENIPSGSYIGLRASHGQTR
jgi:hypothetical protein